jgi:hypothetical protein
MEEKEFNENNSHAENVKVAVDKIIGQKTSTKRIKRTDDEIKKIAFCKAIDDLVYTEERQILMVETHNIDLTSYNSTYYEIIENLFSIMFSKEQIKMIDFFLYDRYTADGETLSITDQEGNTVALDTASDLWEVLKNMK